jgi:putative transposase
VIAQVESLKQQVGVRTACLALGIAHSRYYRQRKPAPDRPQQKASPPRKLSEAERQEVCQTLNSPRFQDCAPREVYAQLLDEGKYLCSLRTMYRILDEQDEVRERRNQLRHPVYRKPELLASAPNQLWSWDITTLRGPVKWSSFYLYVLLDVYSRYVVGWMVALQSAAHLARELIDETCRRQGILPGQLTLHSDRGNPMVAKSLAMLLADLGITKSLSRPSVSNDNPYSEAQFKTMKYCPSYPENFGSLPDARAWGQDFFHWYNCEHYHSGIALLTPHSVHYGLAAEILQKRQNVLCQAYQLHPERFPAGLPQPPQLPKEVWINRPKAPVLELWAP